MRAERHAAVEAGEAVGAVEFDGSPLGVEAVDPVVAAEGVGEADGEEVEAAGVGGVGEVALEGKLLHDGVADEFLVEEDLGAEAGSADVEEDALALPVGGDVDRRCPTRRRRGRRRSAGWGRRRRSGTLRGCRGGLPNLPQWCCSTVVGRVTLMPVLCARSAPAAGGLVDGERLPLPQRTPFCQEMSSGRKSVVVLPLGFFVDPETPVVVGDEGAVFGVGELAGFGLVGSASAGCDRRRRSVRCGGGLQEGAAGDAVGHVLGEFS